MKRQFIYMWRCDACNEGFSATKTLDTHQQDYTLSEVINLILVTVEPCCKNCGSMSIGKITYLKEKEK